MLIQIKDASPSLDGCYARVLCQSEDVARVSLIWQTAKTGSVYNTSMCLGHILIEWKCATDDQYQERKKVLIEQLTSEDHVVATGSLLGQYKSNLALWIPGDGNLERPVGSYLEMASLVDMGGDRVTIMYDREQGISMGSVKVTDEHIEMMGYLEGPTLEDFAITSEVFIEEGFGFNTDDGPLGYR